jgi:hypothetical protein
VLRKSLCGIREKDAQSLLLCPCRVYHELPRKQVFASSGIVCQKGIDIGSLKQCRIVGASLTIIGHLLGEGAACF